ncbi:MAG: DNA-formamidopyrimidine glycosylase [bacterium]|nr:DNA-formamidopyrimidine glycosylase [bacterium]
MPELPEVETIRRQLSQKIIGKKLNGKVVNQTLRRGKILIIEFQDKTNLIFHLKLTGQLLINAEPSNYTRKVFIFNDKTKLIFNDARKFGWFKIVTAKELLNIEKKLGPEPLEISQKAFNALIKIKSNSRIKILLMDQSIIAGIGNIYASEILFVSGVKPDRLVKELREEEIKRIFIAMRSVLKKAIKMGGSSIRDYIDTIGDRGSYAKEHKVYQKEKCFVCGSKIKKIMLSGRSSYFCPKCQR